MIAYTGDRDYDDGTTTACFRFRNRKTDTFASVIRFVEVVANTTPATTPWPLGAWARFRGITSAPKLAFRLWLEDIIHEWPTPRILRTKIRDDRHRTRLFSCRMRTRRDMKGSLA